VDKSNKICTGGAARSAPVHEAALATVSSPAPLVYAP